MHWLFREIAPDEVETEITQRDQFRNDEVDLSDTVVREAVQNSLDAQVPGQQVTVTFTVVGVECGLDESFLRQLFEGQEEHAKLAGLNVHQVLAQSPAALVIEDFGTRGLTGAIDAKDDDNFSDFWRRHGKSHKSGKSGGRWGLGKLVYSYSSRVGAFFGLTIRHGDQHAYLMGQAVLNTHVLNGRRCAPHGFFASVKDSEPGKGMQVPVTDHGLQAQFVQRFGLRRTNEPGLSIVIPFPQEEVNIGRMIAVGVANYFFPILTDQLILVFGDKTVDRSTIRRIALSGTVGVPDAEKVFDFVEAAHELPRDQMIKLDKDWYRDWQLTEEDLGEHLLQALRERFSRRELIGLTLSLEIKRKDGRSEMTSFDLYLKSDPDLDHGHDLYVRGGITVPGEAKLKHRKAVAALVARDEAVCEFLGDAENAAHTRWNSRAEKLLAKYKYGPQMVGAIRNSLVQLYDILGQSVEEEAEDALLEFFWAPSGNEPRLDKPGKSTRGTIIGPINKRANPIQVSKIRGGFSIRASSDATAADFPLRCRARVAYDTPTGNPFKRYESCDFELGGTKGIPVTGKHVRVEGRAGNLLEAVIEQQDFVLQVSGFDSERDIVVRVDTESVT